MPKAIFIQSDGSRHKVEIRLGQSLMEAAIRSGVEGILAECGGSAMCATCHCFVELAPAGLPPMSEEEDVMLNETATPRQDNSRLSCQIRMEQALDGITVRIPSEM